VAGMKGKIAWVCLWGAIEIGVLVRIPIFFSRTRRLWKLSCKGLFGEIWVKNKAVKNKLYKRKATPKLTESSLMKFLFF